MVGFSEREEWWNYTAAVDNDVLYAPAEDKQVLQFGAELCNHISGIAHQVSKKSVFLLCNPGAQHVQAPSVVC